MKNVEYWYRFDDLRGTERVRVSVTKYPVLRHTPKGVWLDIGGGRERFVLKRGRKRFACPTQDAAMESFKARKERQRKILMAQLQGVEAALVAAGEAPESTWFGDYRQAYIAPLGGCFEKRS
jgi:hypothetical protein